MYSLTGKIRGVGSPYLSNRYTDKVRSGKLSDEELLDEATRRVYRNADGVLTLPAWNLKRCFMDGAQFAAVKIGKRSIVPYLKALLIVEPDPDFGRTDYDGLHICKGRVPPRTGAMVTLYRPKLDPGWVLSFRLTVADTTIKAMQLEEIIRAAGLLAGLGAWRPEYGRFVLDELQASLIPEFGDSAGSHVKM